MQFSCFTFAKTQSQRLSRSVPLVFSLAASLAFAQGGPEKSIHERPIGTPVAGSFLLVGKRVMLPSGEFLLAATRTRDGVRVGGDPLAYLPKMIDVAFAQTDGKKLRAAVVAYTLLEGGSGAGGGRWSDESCKRSDTLFRVDLAGGAVQSNCLMVNHFVNAMGSSATGVYGDAATWLQRQGIETPISTMIDAQITRIDAGEKILMVRYAFNPETFNCGNARSQSWAASPWHKDSIDKDPEKMRFVASVVALGKVAQRHVNELIAGRTAISPFDPLPRSLGEIYRCN